jgi:pyrroline-5-carboxylate reductase
VKATVFLGGGRITSALIAGLRLAEYRRPIIVHDRHPEKLRRLKRQYGVMIEPDLHGAVERAQLLIIAVRPDSVRGLLKEIGGYNVGRGLTAISLAAGIPLTMLETGLRPPVRWARAMPSPLCRTGQGLTAISFGRGFSSFAQTEIRKFFALVGTVVEIP